VVVNACETQLLEGQVTQLLDRLVDADCAAFDLLQQFSYVFSLNTSPTLSTVILSAARNLTCDGQMLRLWLSMTSAAF